MGRLEAAALEALDTRLAEFLRSDELELPPYPATLAQLAILASSDGNSVNEYSKVVMSDQALAASTLKRANERGTGTGREIDSLQMAVARVGIEALMSLALAMGAGAIACFKGKLLTLRRQVWRRALYSAEICRCLAEMRGLPAEQAFMCGLMHDFGAIVTLMGMETLLKSEDRSTTIGLEHCTEIMERYHVELGLVVAAQWQLPAVIAQVIREHDSPDEELSELGNLVVCSDRIIDLLEEQPIIDLQDLAAIPNFVSDSERVYVHDQLSGLALIVMDLDPEPVKQQSRLTRTSIEASDSMLNPERMRLKVPIAFQGERGKTSYFTADGLGLFRRAPIREQGLVTVTIESEVGILEFVATVVLCAQDGKRYRVELRPLALPEEMATRWKALTTPKDDEAAA